MVGNGRLREKLETQTAELGLAERVRFHGSLTEPEVAAKLDEADLFVLPSIIERNGDTEGIPVALMEAMAAGVPVVGSRITGVPELVHDRETGLLVEPGDASDLAEKLAEIVEHPAEARARALQARGLVERQFQLRSSASSMLRLFHSSRRAIERTASRGPSRRVPRASLRPPLVLAYHAVGELPRTLDPEGLMVPPAELEAEIGLLLARGYEFVTAAEFARRLRSGAGLERLCALTFDDGSVDNATLLPPLLASLGVPATLFVCPGLLGKPHPWIAPEADVRLMNNAELETVANDELIEIGSHERPMRTSAPPASSRPTTSLRRRSRRSRSHRQARGQFRRTRTDVFPELPRGGGGGRLHERVDLRASGRLGRPTSSDGS